MERKSEGYFEKYLDERLKNVEAKIEEVLQSNRELRSSHRQVFWMMMITALAVILGASGIIYTILYIMFNYVIASVGIIQ
jgi:hypothetical protein